LDKEENTKFRESAITQRILNRLRILKFSFWLNNPRSLKKDLIRRNYLVPRRKRTLKSIVKSLKANKETKGLR